MNNEELKTKIAAIWNKRHAVVHEPTKNSDLSISYLSKAIAIVGVFITPVETFMVAGTATVATVVPRT